MKSMMLIVFLMVAQNAFSSNQTIWVKEQDLENALNVSRPELKIDRSGLGRAWITVDVLHDDIESSYTDTVKIKVPGLFHDLKTDEIKIKDENKTVVCAKIERKQRSWPNSIFTKKIKIKATKACQFETSRVKKEETIDTGFDLTENTKYLLKITVKF